MPDSTLITFRGKEDVEIKFKDHGYEYDTNAHEIEWWFADPADCEGDVTEEEEDAIMKTLYEISNDRYLHWDD